MVEVTSSHIMRREYLNTCQCLELHEQVDLKNKFKLRLHNEVKVSNNEREECIGGYYRLSLCKADLRRYDHCTVKNRSVLILNN